MTVTDTTNKKRETGNGVIVAFSFPFKIFAAADLKVYKVVTATGVATLQTITTDYSVSINSVTNGGTVTYVVAPLATEESLIIRTLEQTQETKFPTESNFPEITIENAIDRNTMITQELQEAITRSVKLSATSAVTTPPDIPDPDTGKALKWKSDGTLENSTNDPDTQTTAAAASAASALVSETAAAASAASTADFTNEGTWSAATTYALSNIVTYTQSSSILGTFQSLQASNLNQNPETQTAFWEKLAEGGAGSPVLTSNVVQASGGATLDDVQEDTLNGFFLYRISDTQLGVTGGSGKVNGKLVINASAVTNTPTLTANKWTDVFIVADGAGKTATLEVIGNLATPKSATATGTNTRCIGSMFSDSANDLTGVKLVQYRKDKVVVLSYIAGDGTVNIEETFTTGVTFEVSKTPTLSFIGEVGGSVEPGEVSDLVSVQQVGTISCTSPTTTTFVSNINASVGLASSVKFAYKAVLEGKYT